MAWDDRRGAKRGEKGQGLDVGRQRRLTDASHGCDRSDVWQRTGRSDVVSTTTVRWLDAL
jgi:hypothetical protein